MRKLLRPVDVLKLGLAGVLDIFEEIHDPLGLFSSSYESIYGWVPERFKRHNFLRTVSRSLKTGDITKIIKGDKVYLRLTSQGKERLKRDFPLLILQKKRWDGRWRVVFYDIAEVNKRQREGLRRKLKELGFGMIQRSVWITPHDFAKDMEEFIKANNLEGKVFILEGRHLLAGDPKVLASKIWELDKLNKAYKRLEEEIEKLKQMYATISDRNKQRTLRSTETMRARYRKRVREARRWYLEILLYDPFLPRELLPSDWLREKIEEEIKKLARLI